MREIEFRGKRKDKDEWIYGSLLIDEIQNIYIIIDNQEGIGREVNPETIGQYTGLKDKNGKKIFEGDIVKVFISGKWWIAKVIYEYSGFTIDVTNNKELEFGRRGIIERFTEVIGNIYDNLELLKEEL